MLLLPVLELVALQHQASLKGWAGRLLALLHDTSRSATAGKQWLMTSGKLSLPRLTCESLISADRLHPVQQPAATLAGRAALAAQAQHMLATMEVADALAWLQHLAAQLHLMKEAANTEPASSPLLVKLCLRQACGLSTAAPAAHVVLGRLWLQHCPRHVA